MTETELAYLAGIVDGEGYIGIKTTPARGDRVTTGFHARIQVRMTDEPAIALLSQLGGSYYRENPHAERGKPLYCWQVSDRLAEQALTALLPYLRVKKQQAETVLELRRLQATGREHRTRLVGTRHLDNGRGVKEVRTFAFSDEYVARCEALRDQVRLLNA